MKRDMYISEVAEDRGRGGLPRPRREARSPPALGRRAPVYYIVLYGINYIILDYNT